MGSNPTWSLARKEGGGINSLPLGRVLPVRYIMQRVRARAYTRQPVTKCQHVEIDIYFQGGPVYLHFNITPCYLKFYVYR